LITDTEVISYINIWGRKWCITGQTALCWKQYTTYTNKNWPRSFLFWSTYYD